MDDFAPTPPSKRILVLEAVKALIKAAVPAATVRGMDNEEAKPTPVDQLGLVIVRSGDPGPAEVDLSPPTYNFDHSIPVEMGAYADGGSSSQQVLDRMMSRIGAAIAADRTLGGLVDWLDAEAPSDGESDARGAKPIGWADFPIIASYSTSNPLT